MLMLRKTKTIHVNTFQQPKAGRTGLFEDTLELRFVPKL